VWLEFLAYLRSISLSKPQITALRAGSSSRSISNSSNARRLRVPPELADTLGAVEVREW
jgi:hypothetical protein